MSPRNCFVTLGTGLLLYATGLAIEPGFEAGETAPSSSELIAGSGNSRVLKRVRHTSLEIENSRIRQQEIAQVMSEATSCCVGKRGNVNCTGIIDLGDLAALVSYLTNSGFVLCCYDETNVNGTGIVDLGDLAALVSYLTGGGYVLPYCPSSGPYASTDLIGVWYDNALATGPGAPFWNSGTITFASDGSFHSAMTSNTQPPGYIDSSFSGTLFLSTAGILYGGPDSSAGSLATGYMDADKSVLVSGSTWHKGTDNGTTEVDILVKNGGSYSQSDLTGTWQGNYLASGPGAPWWDRGSITISPTGLAYGILEDNFGYPDTVNNEAMSISSSGLTSWNGALDAGKTVMVQTNTWDEGYPGTAEFAVFTKVGSNYSLSDLVGTWEGSAIASGPGEPYRSRITVTIQPDGSYFGVETATGSFGTEVDTLSDRVLNISSSGVITISTVGSEWRACLDAGKTILVGTETWNSDYAGTTDLFIFTKMKK